MSLMKEAGLNTLLGMGMTFLVLITLSLIISLFGKILNGAALEKKKTESAKSNAPSAGPGQNSPAAMEKKGSGAAGMPASSEGAGDPMENPALMAVISAAIAAYESDDISPEIVAVIAAAVAAEEEKAGVSGFVVRKIRKSRKRVA